MKNKKGSSGFIETEAKRKVIVPEEILHAGYAITPQAKWVWEILTSHSHPGIKVICPSREEIGEAAGLSVNQVSNYLKELKTIGLIDIRREQKVVGIGVYNIYTLKDTKIWWRRKGKQHKKQIKKDREMKYGKNLPSTDRMS